MNMNIYMLNNIAMTFKSKTYQRYKETKKSIQTRNLITFY